MIYILIDDARLIKYILKELTIRKPAQQYWF